MTGVAVGMGDHELGGNQSDPSEVGVRRFFTG